MEEDNKKNWKYSGRIFNLNFGMMKNYGMSDGGYYHIPLLYLGIGSNGFGVTILGIMFTVAYEK